MVCFLIALVFYATAWLPGAGGFAALGILFEIVALISVIGSASADDDPPLPPHG